MCIILRQVIPHPMCFCWIPWIQAIVPNPPDVLATQTITKRNYLKSYENGITHRPLVHGTNELYCVWLLHVSIPGHTLTECHKHSGPSSKQWSWRQFCTNMSVPTHTGTSDTCRCIHISEATGCLLAVSEYFVVEVSVLSSWGTLADTHA